jgi:hypothetical protein
MRNGGRRPTTRALVVVLALIGLVLATSAAQAQDKKPNIVIIWGDDIGITDVGAYSHGLMGFQTPIASG